MGRIIIIDERVNEALKAQLDNYITQTGLVIGAIDKTTDYVVYTVATPVGEEFDVDLESTEKKKKEPINQKMIVSHALQIHDMLVGGMDILGIYGENLPVSAGVQILNKIYSALNKFEYYKQMNFSSERLLFVIDSKTKNINIKTVDIADSKATSRPCDIVTKTNLFSNEFNKLNSNFNLNATFTTPNVKSYNLLKEDFYAALSTSSMFNENKFVCLINNCILDDNKSFSELEPILTQLQPNQEHEHEYQASLMENLSVSKTADDSKVIQQNMDSIYQLTGVCSLMVIFHESMTVQTIRKQLVYDLMRSLYARVRLLVEDLDLRKDVIGDAQLEDPDPNDESSIEESYQTPVRIFVHLNELNNSDKSASNQTRKINFVQNFLITDYVFPDEIDLDICDRIKEVFNCDLTEPDRQIINVENFPPEIKMSQSEDLRDKIISGDSNDVLLSNSSTNHKVNGVASSGSGSNMMKQSEGILQKGTTYFKIMLFGVLSSISFWYIFKVANFLNDDNE